MQKGPTQYIASPLQVRQMYYRSASVKEKETQLVDILNVVTIGQCIIFANTRDAVERVGKQLEENGHPVSMLHGRMEETARDKVRRPSLWMPSLL